MNNTRINFSKDRRIVVLFAVLLLFIVSIIAFRWNDSVIRVKASKDTNPDITVTGAIISSAMLGKNIYHMLAESEYILSLENDKNMSSLERASAFDHLAYRKYTVQTDRLNPIEPKYESVNDPNSPLMGTGSLPDDIKDEGRVDDQSNELIEFDQTEPNYRTYPSE